VHGVQAARGTSLTGDDPEVDRPTNGRHRLLFVGVAVTAYVVDVATKVWAMRHLADRGPVPLVGDLLQLNLVRNPGAAFSTGTRFTLAFSLLAIVAAIVVLVLARKVGDWLWAVAFGLLFAGIVGNLTDRIFRDPGPFRGHVVDFLELPHWPVFNVADMCINVAAVLIVIQSVRGVGLDGRRSHRAGSSLGDDGAGDTADGAGDTAQETP